MTEAIYLSREGRLKLEAELRRLKFEERPKLVAETKRAMELGDLAENAEYHAAKEAQQHLEKKVAELEDKLSRVRTIDADKIATDKVYLFTTVLVRDLRDNSEVKYRIVPPDETDVDNNVISAKSPVGAALLGRSRGEKVVISVPVGQVEYEILGISRQ